MNKPSSLASGSAKNTLAAAALAVAGTLGANNAQAESEKHKGVMMAVGMESKITQGYVLDVMYDKDNPANSKVTAGMAFEDVSSFDQIINYARFFSGRSFCQKVSPKKASPDNKAGFQIYHDPNTENGKNKPNIIFDDSNTEDFNKDDIFYKSTGKTEEKDWVIGINNFSSDILKTYDIIKRYCRKNYWPQTQNKNRHQ